MDNALTSPPAKRSRISTSENLDELNKDELIKKVKVLQEYIQQLENKQSINPLTGSLTESGRRENVLVMRLANKEQEAQDCAAQIAHIKKSQENIVIQSLRQANLDPGVNLLFGKMREELQQTKDKLEQAQNELSAWKFTPDSQNGKKLMSRCRTLIAENQELGEQLSQGKTAQLEAELALQTKYNDELKASQDELNEFVIQLDEEVEGMQSTIQVLQKQLLNIKQKETQLNHKSDDKTIKNNLVQQEVKQTNKNDNKGNKSNMDDFKSESPNNIMFYSNKLDESNVENYEEPYFHDEDHSSACSTPLHHEKGSKSPLESQGTPREEKIIDWNNDTGDTWESRTSIESDNSNDPDIKAYITSITENNHTGNCNDYNSNERTPNYEHQNICFDNESQLKSELTDCKNDLKFSSNNYKNNSDKKEPVLGAVNRTLIDSILKPKLEIEDCGTMNTIKNSTDNILTDVLSNNGSFNGVQEHQVTNHN